MGVKTKLERAMEYHLSPAEKKAKNEALKNDKRTKEEIISDIYDRIERQKKGIK